MSGSFDPRRARAKRPCPFWMDAFVRDTLELEREDIGSYFLIVAAMWANPACAVLMDHKKLARVARVTPRKWSTTTKHILLPFFKVEGDMLISKRLRKEAEYTERSVTQQHCRRVGSGNVDEILAAHPWGVIAGNPKFYKKATKLETHMGHKIGSENETINQTNLLNNNNVGSTVDNTVDTTTEVTYPITQAKGGGDDKREARIVEPESLTIRERILVAMGHDKSGITANGRLIGSPADMAIFKSWIGLGLSITDIIEQVAHISAQKRDGPANSFKYFTRPMQELAGAKQAPALEPIQPPEGGGQAHGCRNHEEEKFRIAVEAAAKGTVDVDYG